MIDATAVKDAVRIEEIIGEDEPLKPVGGGRRHEGQRHHSLTVYPGDQYYVWFSKGERGDVFDWLRLHRGLEFREALILLAQRAHLDVEWTPEQKEQYLHRRQKEDAFTAAARHWAQTLHASPDAMAYCEGRGWGKQAVVAAGLGYCDGDHGALRDTLQAAGVDVDSKTAKATFRCGKGMLVYPHVERGRVVCWSARSIEGKRHYNPPRDLVGERLPYFNHAYASDAQVVVIVEGQADAVTLGTWGIAAVALAGCAISDDMADRLQRHSRLSLGLDDDEEGRRATGEIANSLGPLVQVVRWPDHDCNDWARNGGSAEAALALLREAPAWVELVAQGIQVADDRDAALRHMVELAAKMTDFQLGTRREGLAKAAGIGLRQFDKLLKTVKEKKKEEEEPGALLDERTVPGGVVETKQGDVVFEMIITTDDNGKRYSAFAVRWPDGKTEIVRSLMMNGIVYTPYEASMALIEKGVVLLPSEIGKYESTQTLMRDICDFIHCFLDVSPFYEKIAAYYVLLSWLYDCFTVLPYLRALGDYGTGKSRFLETIGSICYRPIKTSGASTFSPVFRVIEMFHGTLILDEMDMTMTDTEADFIKLLNSGIARGTPLLRTEKAGDRWVVEAYDTFCPKIVGTRKRFQDRALESRMLTYEMGAGCRANIPLVLPGLFYEVAQDLRDKLLTYRLQNWRRMEVDYNLADRTVEPRLSQVTLALKTIVDDPTLQAEIDLFIREYHRQTIVERGMTLSALILEVIVELREQPVGAQLDGTPTYDLSMKRIAKIVNERMDEENYPDEESAKSRPRLMPRKVGAEVRKLGLATQRRPDKSRVFEVVWDEERVEGLKVRYGLV